MRWGGGEGTGKDSITVFTSEGLSRGARIDLLWWPHGAVLGPAGVGVGVARRQISAQYKKKFVTIGAAQPA